MNEAKAVTDQFYPNVIFEYFNNRYVAAVKEMRPKEMEDNISYTIQLLPNPFENESPYIMLQRIFKQDGSWIWRYENEQERAL